MFHGNGESLSSIDEYAASFLNLGYNLMAWDYPGYGRSTDCRFSEASLLDDAERAYQWLAQQESANRIVIFGYSVGTGIALSVASHHQQNPVFLVAAYDSLTNVASEKMPAFIPTGLLIRYPMNTASWLASIKQPVYFIHGAQDTLIRPARAQALIQKVKGIFKLELVANAGHTDNYLYEYRNQWLKKLLP
jgi:pimeloyl-ACP methyl ester carboxylesterase